MEFRCELEVSRRVPVRAVLRKAREYRAEGIYVKKIQEKVFIQRGRPISTLVHHHIKNLSVRDCNEV